MAGAAIVLFDYIFVLNESGWEHAVEDWSMLSKINVIRQL